MRFALRAVALSLSLPALPGCGSKDTGAAGEADATEAPTTFEGSVTVQRAVDGVLDCDMRVRLEGTTYTGRCLGCDFAFRIDSTIEEDNSTASDCDDYLPLLWIDPNRPDRDTYLAFISELSIAEYYGYDSYYYYYYGYSPVFTDVLLWGYRDGMEVYWYPVALEGGYYGHYGYYGHGYYGYGYFGYGIADLAGDLLTWTAGYAYLDTDFSAYEGEPCGDLAEPGDQAYPAPYSGADDVRCDGGSLDVWTFQSDGGPAEITVDTTSAATAFDPLFWVNDGSSCWIGESDDSFPCAYPPPSFECPSMQIPETDGGVYQVVVTAYGSCAEPPIGEYSIAVNQASDPSLALFQDDYDGVVSSTVLTSVGEGTVMLP